MGEYKSEIAEIKRKSNSNEEELHKVKRNVEECRRKNGEDIKKSSEILT
jgi:hypothetical protein